MAWTPRLRQLSALAIATGAGLTTYYYQELRSNRNIVHASWTNSDKPINPCALWDHNWDRRDPKNFITPLRNDSPEERTRYQRDLEKERPMAKRHIILVRIGEYDGDTNDSLHLTERGRLQAKYAGHRLHEMNFKWDKVIVATTKRAQETAEIMLKEQLDFDAKVRENSEFLVSGLPVAPQPAAVHVYRGPPQQFFRDGARMEAEFRQYFYRADAGAKQDSYTLIIGHGNVIRYFVLRALQLPPEAWQRITLNHGSITWLSIGPKGNVSIRCLGDSGYMPVKYLKQGRVVKSV